jgi:hypothetical protein
LALHHRHFVEWFDFQVFTCSWIADAKFFWQSNSYTDVSVLGFGGTRIESSRRYQFIGEVKVDEAMDLVWGSCEAKATDSTRLLVRAVGIGLKAMLKTRKLLIPLNAKNAKNTGFAQVRYTRGTRWQWTCWTSMHNHQGCG